jgi:segregation and condensation protein A
MSFTINLERFSGPYTLLLDMIEDRKLSITEVSLARITDDYIAYVKTIEDESYGDISQFVVVAATLMLIKVKSLLPGIFYTEDEEAQVHDLEKKLELHAVVRKASKHIAKTFGKSVLYEGKRASLTAPVFSPSPMFAITTLHSIVILMKAALERVEKIKTHAVVQTLRLEDVMETLQSRLSQIATTSFKALVGSTTDSIEKKKEEIIVTFLALLELVKGGVLFATQHDGDIHVTNRSVSEERV